MRLERERRRRPDLRASERSQPATAPPPFHGFGNALLARALAQLQRDDTPTATPSPAPTPTPVADPKNDAQALLDDKPTTNKDYAAWILKAQAHGFVVWSTAGRAQKDIEALAAGTKVAKVDPASTTIAGSLAWVHDVVKDQITRWIAKPEGVKETLTLGSFLTSSGGTERDAPHGTGEAFDINALSVETSVEPVLRILGDLDKGSYELGLPFQGEFFPAEEELAAKRKAAEEKATADKTEPAPVTGALQLFRTHLWSSAWNAEKKAWDEPKIETNGAAYTLLKSEKLRDKIKSLRAAGYSFTIYPDNKGHMHLEKNP